MDQGTDKKLHRVSVEASPIVLYNDLKKKIAETRVKRDAIMLAHNSVNKEQDKYNKCIICLSLFSAFFESTKAQLNLATRTDWIAPIAILAPIFLSTILGIISSLMKFKKFPERMELLSKATEKSNASILQMRRLLEALNFQPYKRSYDEYSGPTIAGYRDSLDCYERALYPHEHDIYIAKALAIATEVAKREKEQESSIELLLHSEKSRHVIDKFPGNVQLESPFVRSNSALGYVQEDSSSEDGSTNNVSVDIVDNIPQSKEFISKSSIPSKLSTKNVKLNSVIEGVPTEIPTEVDTKNPSEVPTEVPAEVPAEVSRPISEWNTTNNTNTTDTDNTNNV